jgi:hypothetical protein
MYGHAERVRLAAQRATAETIELLLRLPSLNDEQLQFMQEFAPERPRRWARGRDSGCAEPSDRKVARARPSPRLPVDRPNRP